MASPPPPEFGAPPRPETVPKLSMISSPPKLVACPSAVAEIAMAKLVLVPISTPAGTTTRFLVLEAQSAVVKRLLRKSEVLRLPSTTTISLPQI